MGSTGPGEQKQSAASRWSIAEPACTEAETLAAQLGVHPAVIHILYQRGVTERDAMDSFLNPRLSTLSDPFLLPDMPAAVDRIWSAIQAAETIVVHGDYDVDGITSTALLYHVLSQLGARVHAFIPHRIEDGYGLSEDTVQQCIDRWSPAWLVTVDCGTNSVSAVKAARRAGVHVIITDHHTPAADVAEADALINPKLSDMEEVRMLAGVGVTFKLAHALVKAGRQRALPAAGIDLRPLLDLVGLGTLCDMVPLQHENRILASYGLRQLADTAHPGLHALVKASGIQPPFHSYHAGYVLGPRLNAAGRMYSPDAAFQLLVSQDEEGCFELAEQLDQANRDRQVMEKEMVEQAMIQVETWLDLNEHFAVVAYGHDWHPGVIGIAAQRLCRKYHRPAVVIALDEQGVGKGSCRSIDGFDMVSGLDACGSHLTEYGGHQAAAGLTIQADKLEAFIAAFHETARTALQGRDLRPEIHIDLEIPLSQVQRELYDACLRLEPFGEAHRRPVFCTRGVRLVRPPSVVGQRHLKMRVAQGGIECDAIAFGMADRVVPEGVLDMAYTLNLNTFRGRETLQCQMLDFAPPAPAN